MKEGAADVGWGGSLSPAYHIPTPPFSWVTLLNPQKSGQDAIEMRAKGTVTGQMFSKHLPR